MITRENYEIWFIDFFDRNLDSNQEAMLFSFLEDNQDLKIEFESFDNISLNPTKETLDNKLDLKKDNGIPEVNLNNFELFAIADMEEGLTNSDKQKLNKLSINHPEIKKEIELVNKTKLSPTSVEFEDKEALKQFNFSSNDGIAIAILEGDKVKTSNINQSLVNKYAQTKLEAPSISFPNKRKLKQKETKVIPFFKWSTYAAAASVLLIFGIKSYNQNQKTENYSPRIAKFKNITQPKIEINNDFNTNLAIKESKSDTSVNIEKEIIVKKNNDYSAPNNANLALKNEDKLNLPEFDSTKFKFNKNNIPSFKFDDITNGIAKDSASNLEENIANNLENNNQNTTDSTNNTNTLNKTKELTGKELITSTIKERILNQDASENPNISGNDIAESLVNGIGKLTHQEAEYLASNDDGDYKTVSFSIGKFGFSRTKKK